VEGQRQIVQRRLLPVGAVLHRFQPATIQAGQWFSLYFGIANCGTADIPAGWKIRYYASLDTTITAADHSCRRIEWVRYEWHEVKLS
jgi:hypothetical protein